MNIPAKYITVQTVVDCTTNGENSADKTKKKESQDVDLAGNK